MPPKKKKPTKEITLSDWFITFSRHGVFVQGKLRKSDSQLTFYKTSSIKNRINSHTLRSSTGTIYHLLGDLNPAVGSDHEPFVSLFQQGFPRRWKKMLNNICKESGGTTSGSHVINSNRTLTKDCALNEKHTPAKDGPSNSKSTWRSRDRPYVNGTKTNDDAPTLHVRDSTCLLNEDCPMNSSRTPLVKLRPIECMTITNDDAPTLHVRNATCLLNEDRPTNSNSAPLVKPRSNECRKIINDDARTTPVRDLPDNINTLTSNQALNKNRSTLTTGHSPNSNVTLNSTSNQLSNTPYKLSKIYRRLKMLNSKPIMSSFIYDSDNETCQLDTTLFNRPGPLLTPMQNYPESSSLPPTRPQSNTNITTSLEKRMSVNSHVRYKLDEHDCTLIHPINSSLIDNVEQIRSSNGNQSNNSNEFNKTSINNKEPGKHKFNEEREGNKSNTNKKKVKRKKENHLKTNTLNNKECMPLTQSTDPLFKNSEPLQLKGGKNSFKRRKQLHELLMMKEMNNGDDFLTSTPFRNDNQPKHAEYFEADLVTTPSSYLACTPGGSMLNTTEEPTIQASLNKNKLERYALKLELNRKKKQKLPKGTSKQTKTTKTSKKTKAGFNWNEFSDKMQNSTQHPKPKKRSKINTDLFCDQQQQQEAYQSDEDDDDDYYFSD